uniref:Uncharacterized protein n=1 Tax=Peronospora matthiolae TaxID=2874970 RepID=A0AAV1T2Y5_9STRA
MTRAASVSSSVSSFICSKSAIESAPQRPCRYSRKQSQDELLRGGTFLDLQQSLPLSRSKKRLDNVSTQTGHHQVSTCT